MSAPYFYDQINAVTSQINPSTVHSQNTFLTAYYRRYLLQRAISVFDWQLPEDWDKGYFLYTLYMAGHCAVINTDAFGIIPQHCGLWGRGVQYEPTHAVISNPLLKGLLRPRIGTECTVIRLMPDWGGLMDMVCNYAEALALADEATSFGLINSKLAYVFLTKNKAGAETFKKMYDQISKGNPAVVIDKDLTDDADGEPWQYFSQDLRNNFIAPDTAELRRRLVCMFDSAVGIDSNLAYDKKERINTAEVTANNHETFLNAAIWLDCLKKSVKQTNELFGLDIKVDWRIKPEEVKPDATVITDPVQ